jgi:peptidoglycan biosynthesis protein MviN/MurJ (putative lipid II flippase)
MAANASFLQGTFAYSTEIKSKQNFEEGLLRAGLKIFGIIFICSLLFFPLAGIIIPLFYSRSDEANFTLLNSSRLFFILASFLAASGVFAALLQMKGKITNPGRLIVFLNVFSIVSLFFFKNELGILSIPFGFLIGASLFFIYQLILLKKDRRITPEEEPETPADGFKFSAWMAVAFLLYANAIFPSVLGLMERFFAYTFAGGTFSHYQYAQKILQLPLTILSFAISTSLLPFQVKSINEGKEDEFAAATKKGITVSILTSAFFALIFFAAAEPVIQILFKRGMFNTRDMLETALALRILSIGLIPYLLTPIIANIYFARGAVKNILIINTFFVVIQAVSLGILSYTMPGIKALSINWVILAWLNNLALIIYSLRKKYFAIAPSFGVKMFLLIIFTAVIAICGNAFIPVIGGALVQLLFEGAIMFGIYLMLGASLFGREAFSYFKRNRR